ncbi:MAG TPA: hypothetical protein VIJ46_02080 [Rhabdochlamydiaceae bacterium]
MATLAIHQPPHIAGTARAPATPQEEPTFLETTVRVSTVSAALYYASLATWAYPVLGMTCFVASAIVTYSKVSGIPVQDLIDNICDRCIPAQPIQSQALRRIVQPIFVPSEPGSIHGVLSFPVTIQEVMHTRAPSPELTLHSPAPQLVPAIPSAALSQIPTGSPTPPANNTQQRGFVVMGEFPDTAGYVPQSLLNSTYFGRAAAPSTSTQKV